MQKRILFVDDDLNFIAELKQQLSHIKVQWKTEFANNGSTALAIMDQKSIDVIVTDMQMPGMDGVELLNKVMKLHPGTIRIIVSDPAKQEMDLNAVKAAHQFLAKPCEIDTLINTIERTYILSSLFTQEAHKKLITGLSNLPSHPQVYSNILAEIQSPNASIKNIADLISHDLPMTAKIFQLVNSAYFGLAQRVYNLPQAISLLGLDVLKSLILYVQIFSTFKANSAFSENLWNHSLAVGLLAREIAKTERKDKNFLDQVFLAGVLHDIGKLILLQFPQEHQQLSNNTDNSLDTLTREYGVFGTSHAEIGAYLLGLWGYPIPIVEAIAFHHRPIHHLDQNFSILTATHLANALSKLTQANTIDQTGLDQIYIQELGLSKRIPVWSEVALKSQ